MAAPPVSPVAALRAAAQRAVAAGEPDAARVMRGYAATLERDPGALARIRAQLREQAGPEKGTQTWAVWGGPAEELEAVARARAATAGADAGLRAQVEAMGAELAQLRREAQPVPVAAPVGAIVERLQRATVPDGRTWEAIAEAAARADGVSLDDVVGTHRLLPMVRARYRAWWEIHRAGRYSYAYLARVWGVDHSTVMHGVTAHEARTRRERAA